MVHVYTRFEPFPVYLYGTVLNFTAVALNFLLTKSGGTKKISKNSEKYPWPPVADKPSQHIEHRCIEKGGIVVTFWYQVDILSVAYQTVEDGGIQSTFLPKFLVWTDSQTMHLSDREIVQNNCMWQTMNLRT